MASYPSWIEYAPLKRNWEFARVGKTSRLCEVKSIAIHYTEAPGQTANEIRAWFNNDAGPNQQKLHDLTAIGQGSPFFGTHFVVDKTKVLALAPDPSYIFYHVGDKWANAANRNYWNQNKTKYIRGDANYYAIGIEHCHDDETGKLAEATLKNSHKLVTWLKEQYGKGLEIGRHYDYSGKCCPLYFAPIIEGRNDYDPNTNRTKFESTEPTQQSEIQLKNYRWSLLLGYYRQSDPNAVPPAILS